METAAGRRRSGKTPPRRFRSGPARVRTHGGGVVHHLHLVAAELLEGEAEGHVGLAVERRVLPARGDLDHRSVGDFGTVPAIEFGLGYAAGPMRLELLVEYRPDFAFKGRANFLAPGTREEVRAKLSSVSGMLAGFVDLAGMGLPKPGPFAPFVGAGVGVVHTRIGKTTMTFPATTTTVPAGNRTGLAWMVTVGVGMAVGERAILDLAWRYTDLGKVRTGRGPGRVVWRDGSREPLPLDLAPTEARLRGHGIRLSLRYAF